VDAAGLLGTVLGYGIGYASGDDTNDPANGSLCPTSSVRRCVNAARYALGGLAVGLLSSAVLTSRLKPGQKSDLPRADALLSRHDERWALGLPNLRLSVQPTPEGIAQQAVVDLARGEW